MTWLTLFAIGLLVTILIVAFQKNARPKAVMPAQIIKKTNEQLIQLISHANDSGKTYSLPEKRMILDVTEPITISKDSFYLRGNGAILRADSLYKGPAVIISANAKQIVLDSLVFENFDVGLLLRKNNITLKNVRFINCRVPVQYLVSLPDSVISGRFSDSIFINNSNLKK